MIVNCPYCSQDAILTDSAEVYHGRSYGMIWLCRPCQAWVGVHKDTQDSKPLGRLANKELREWKQKAHAAFDPLWQEKLRRRIAERGPAYRKHYARGSAYRWLAEQLAIPFNDCHIGMFDVDTCKRVVALCKPYADKLRRAA
jgi:zinc-finger-containing domain